MFNVSAFDIVPKLPRYVLLSNSRRDKLLWRIKWQTLVTLQYSTETDSIFATLCKLHKPCSLNLPEDQ